MCTMCACEARDWRRNHRGNQAWTSAAGDDKWGFYRWLTLFGWYQHIPECVARVPVSLWGSGGWGCVRSTLRLWSQPSATVRNRPREDHMAVPMVSSAEVVIFGGFRRVVASFRVAGVALRVIQTCFATCWKSFAWQAQYFCDVFRRCVAVFVAGSALWTCPSSFFVAGAAL